MRLIKNKIVEAKKELNELNETFKKSFNSVKEHWASAYHNSFSDKCEMVYFLAQGKLYKPYRFDEDFKIERAREWKKDICLDYCHIRFERYGAPSGFISVKNGLFDATSSKHKSMWLKAIETNKEVRSFEDFKKQLKKDTNFLIKSFEEGEKEHGSGVFSTEGYLTEFEEKRLKTGKYYIYLEGTTRKY